MVFVYAELVPQPVYAYHQPLLTAVKRCFPALTCLDLDSFSEEFLIMQAGRLLAQADRCVVYFASAAPETPPGATLLLAEVLLRRPAASLVGLQGQHTRFERLFAQRPNLVFLPNPSETLFLEQLTAFLE